MTNLQHLPKIRIVLSHTSHPGNIGATARAMKTMGLSQLVLVNPVDFPSEKAIMMAAGADDILEKAQIVTSVSEAINDCVLVVGTSARSRSLPWSMLDPKQCAEKIVVESELHNVALLFGREKFGLTNDELQMCQYHVQIPANPEYCSLNLAAAAQVLCYELYQAALGEQTHSEESTLSDLATAREIEGYIQHLEKVLHEIKFIDPAHPNRIMQRLRRLYQRARLENTEIHILRGILTEIERSTGR